MSHGDLPLPSESIIIKIKLLDTYNLSINFVIKPFYFDNDDIQKVMIDSG